ncbi:MAG: transposase [Pseudomonadota bacterium]
MRFGAMQRLASALVLKVILFAYGQGIVSRCGIERACREHVTFIALCGDTAPHFTTLAGFISTLGDEVARIFGQVLFICDRQGLIGREMFAIDGVKLRSQRREESEWHAGGLRASSDLRLRQRHLARSRTTQKRVFLQPQRPR